MSAKFIAQIEISKPCVSSASRPAEATRPRIVSSSGSPAATSEPKARTRIASVTGQEKSSGLHHRLRFASLKSAPHAGGAGQRDRTPVADRRAELGLQLVGGGDHRRRVARAPAMTTAVCPSAEIGRAARGA